MAQNDYQTFGDSGTDGVNKLSLADYTADNDRVYGNGYTTKVIRSQLHNKALQQTSKISAAVAQFLVNNGQDALDTDSFSTLATKLCAVSTFVKIDTIASLRAMTSTPSTVYVTGYTTANDNAFGSNFFKWNPTSTVADNGGTIIKLTGTLTGRYELQYSGAVDVKWFGADATGVADSTAAIQASVNAAVSNKAAVYISAGTYKVSSSILVSSPIDIIGSGIASTIIAPTSTFTGGSVLNVTSGGKFTHMNFSIQCNVPPTGLTALLYSTGSLNQATIKNIFISGCYDGLSITQTQYGATADNIHIINNVRNAFTIDAANMTLSNSYAINNGGIGFNLTAITGQSANIVMSNNTAYYSGAGNFVFQGNATYGINDAVLTNLTSSDSPNNTGILFDTYGVRNSISNSYIEQAGMDRNGAYISGQHGLYITVNNTDTLVNGVQSWGNGGSGIYVNANNTTVANSIFRGNSLFSNIYHGIIVGGNASSNLNFTGNSSVNNAGYGIGFYYVGTITNSIISNMIMTGNTLGQVYINAGTTAPQILNSIGAPLPTVAFAGVSASTSGKDNTITVTDTGASGANILLAGNGTVTPNKYIRAQNGALSMVNNNYNAEIFNISDSGNLSIGGSFTAHGAVVGTKSAPTNATVGASTLTAGQMLTGNIIRTGSTAAYTDTTDTAANIIASIPNPIFGVGYELTIVNTVAYTETIAAGTGVTLRGTTTIAASSSRKFVVIITNITTPAVDLVGICSGGL